MNGKKLIRLLARIICFPRVCRLWWRKGMAWPWIMILTGLATGIIAVLTKWISQNPSNPGP